MTLPAALTDWLTALNQAVASNSFIKLSLTKPTLLAGDLKSVDTRPILVKRELKLSFTHHYKTRDIVKNYTTEESTVLLGRLLSAEFKAARLCTLAEDIFLSCDHAGSYTLRRSSPSQKDLPSLGHDKPKHHLLKADGKTYLHALGLTDAAGNVHKNAQDKFRQINKYIETLDSLIKQLPQRTPLHIVDMGSGKGYLTFALYDHLVKTLGRDAVVTGVEFRSDMVNLCNDIASMADFKQLRFVQGAIADYDCTGANIVIALHACDTATDDAIYKAIQADADLIVVAPCCHKQIRREMTVRPDNQLGFMLRYGTYAERMAEMVTDSLRALLLELCGYTPKVFEFISDAHTPKNVMIVATKAQKRPDEIKVHAEIAAAKAQFGIKTHYLERRLTDQK